MWNLTSQERNEAIPGTLYYHGKVSTMVLAEEVDELYIVSVVHDATLSNAMRGPESFVRGGLTMTVWFFSLMKGGRIQIPL